MLALVRRSLRHRYGILLTILFLVIAAGFIWIYADKHAPDKLISSSSPYLEAVSEEPIAPDYKWHGKSDEPKYIRLPTINTEGFVESVGLAVNHEIKVPSNIHTVGWFNQSAKLGQPGLSVIDGHVDGRTRPGIFRRLSELKQSDQLTVQLGDETIKTYQVLSVETVDTTVALSVLFSQSPDVTSQLNLITCGGAFNKQSKTYDKRVIVSTELVEVDT